MFEEILNTVLSEYGVFMTFLMVTVGSLVFAVRSLWRENKALGEKLLETVQNNTKVLTQILEKLDSNEPH